jgi:hypothetical protein
MLFITIIPFIYIFICCIYSGKTTCKSIAKDHETIYSNSIPLNYGFGRRIDLILSTKNIKLCTNEWKRSKTTAYQYLVQQGKKHKTE